MFENWIYSVKGRTSLTWFPGFRENNFISASVGPKIDEKCVGCHREVLMLEMDLAVHCRIKI